MWPRIIEALLGVWLAGSPWIFAGADDPLSWSINDVCCGVLVIALAAACFHPSLRFARFLQLGVGCWLTGFGYLADLGNPNPPALQNDMVVGLSLLMFALIPNEANRPPLSWRPFLRS